MPRATFLARCLHCNVVWACLELSEHDRRAMDALLAIEWHCPACGVRVEALAAVPYVSTARC